MLPSASVGAKVALFETDSRQLPCQAAGEKSLPTDGDMILSAAMMLEHVGLEKEGKATATPSTRRSRLGVVTEDLVSAGGKAASTTEVGDFIAAAV